MAQDNKKFIQDVYDAYGRGDTQFILDHITENVDWINEGPKSIPYAGTFRGANQVQRFFEALGTTVENGRVKAEDWITESDKVVATGRFTATVKSTGKRIDVPIAHVFTIRNGKIARWVGYADTAAVAEAYAGSAQSAML